MAISEGRPEFLAQWGPDVSHSVEVADVRVEHVCVDRWAEEAARGEVTLGALSSEPRERALEVELLDGHVARRGDVGDDRQERHHGVLGVLAAERGQRIQPLGVLEGLDPMAVGALPVDPKAERGVARIREVVGLSLGRP